MGVSPQFQILHVKVIPRASTNSVEGWAGSAGSEYGTAGPVDSADSKHSAAGTAGPVDSADSKHGAVLIKVTAPAEGGKANEAVIRLLADELNIPKSAIKIKRGETSRHKQVALDVNPEVIQAWLKQL